jgi:hypothetical protein
MRQAGGDTDVSRTYWVKRAPHNGYRPCPPSGDMPTGVRQLMCEARAATLWCLCWRRTELPPIRGHSSSCKCSVQVMSAPWINAARR